MRRVSVLAISVLAAVFLAWPSAYADKVVVLNAAKSKQAASTTKPTKKGAITPNEKCSDCSGDKGGGGDNGPGGGEDDGSDNGDGGDDSGPGEYDGGGPDANPWPQGSSNCDAYCTEGRGSCFRTCGSNASAGCVTSCERDYAPCYKSCWGQ